MSILNEHGRFYKKVHILCTISRSSHH